MDLGTELALRAIMRGLYHSDAISSDTVRAVMAALKEAAGAAMDRREGQACKELLALGKGIRLDTAVEPHHATA
jgi:hypothetical protein